MNKQFAPHRYLWLLLALSALSTPSSAVASEHKSQTIIQGIGLMTCSELAAIRDTTIDLVEEEFIGGVLTGLSVQSPGAPGSSLPALVRTDRQQIKQWALQWCRQNPAEPFAFGVMRGIFNKEGPISSSR